MIATTFPFVDSEIVHDCRFMLIKIVIIIVIDALIPSFILFTLLVR